MPGGVQSHGGRASGQSALVQGVLAGGLEQNDLQGPFCPQDAQVL